MTPPLPPAPPQLRPWERALAQGVFPVIAMIPAGFLALVEGQRASRAFSDLSGDLILRLLVGAPLFAGGLLVVVGIVRADPVWRAAGLVIGAVGALVYGLGVVFGLGLNGAVAGVGYLAIAVWLLVQVWLMFRMGASGAP